MNYRHLYHAGNFADVVKHVILIALFNHFKEKEPAFCCLDTHAGIGLYELNSIETQKKKEYETGILKLFFAEKKSIPSEIQDYISMIEKLNGKGKFSFYPGSPWIAKSLMRDQDKLILCELHTEDYQTLKDNFRGEKNIAIHHQDAYLGMKAFLPPKEKRGLVLIDPPFEMTNEFECIENALKTALKHWKSGCFMVWYPIKENAPAQHFLKNISALSPDYLAYHFSIDPMEAKTALSRCGILIINPPWKLSEKLETSVLPYLTKQLQATWSRVCY
ncbi:MAG: 23S rRNA (adenine(2030)-N(6))-methyltransferase RlmJ [Coxiellaceae bacterium]|nr:23S rRNA (adenine(2030)-N(6))-methyltransferase RlmJ [Coxiellaceae bacterium]